MTEVEKVLNSHQDFQFDASFSIMVSYASPPAGSALDQVPPVLKNRLLKSTNVVVIKNTDSICMARAIVVGVARLTYDNPTYRKMRDDRNRLQKDTAM